VTSDAAPPRSRPARGGAHRAPRTAPGVSRPAKPRDTVGRPGLFGLGGRSRSMLARVCAGALLAGVIGVGLLQAGVPSAEPTVTQFLLAWESRHYLQAAELTNGSPKVVATQLAQAYERLDAADVDLIMRGVSQHGRTALAKFGVAIDLSASGLTWTYDNSFSLTDGSNGWRVNWSPSVIVPGMANGEQLAVVSHWAARSQLLDSAGQSLAVRSLVYLVGVVPDRLTDPGQTAADLGYVTKIPEDQIEGQMDQAPSATFFSLLTLSPAEYKKMQARLKRIPGLVIKQRRERLFDSIAPDVVGSVGTETAELLRENGEQYRPGTTVGESGLQQAFQRQLTGTPETEVVLQRGKRLAGTLKIWQGSRGTPVHTTLNSTVQIAADQALAAPQMTSGAIVAVQAETGKILAVASRTAGHMPQLSPLAGEYEPGQAFTIISTAAILSASPLPANAVVPCPQHNSVNGISFRNDPPLPTLGANSSFGSDFAHACSTAFAGGLAQSITASDLASAGQDFGIGGWRLPGTTSFAGRIGQPASSGVLAEDLIGDGGVRVSPLDMALAASVIDAGRWHVPSLVTGLTDPSATSRTAASGQVLAELQSLMRNAASTGSNAVADVGRDVYGQAGSAPYGTRHLWLHWFVGYRQGVAFAVVQLSRSADTSAAPLAGRFLQDIQPGGPTVSSIGPDHRLHRGHRH
jgi:cell division protein FtsI/penicillin-binding protein 2